MSSKLLMLPDTAACYTCSHFIPDNDEVPQGEGMCYRLPNNAEHTEWLEFCGHYHTNKRLPVRRTLEVAQTLKRLSEKTVEKIEVANEHKELPQGNRHSSRSLADASTMLKVGP